MTFTLRSTLSCGFVMVSLAAASFLSGCATRSDPQVVYQKVAAPISSSCIPQSADLTPPKIHSDAELKATDGPQRYLWTSADRKAALAWIEMAEPILKGCS